MIRGLVKAFTFTLGLSATCSYTKVGSTISPIFQASTFSQWTPNGSDLIPGLSISLYADTSNTSITFRNEYLNDEIIHTDTGFLTLDWAYITVTGSVFAEYGAYRFDYDGIRVVSKDGSGFLSLAGTINLGYQVPSSIPFIGIPPKTACSLGPSYAPVMGVPPTYTTAFSHSLEGEGEVRASWTIDNQAFGCTVGILDPPTLDGLLPLPSVTCDYTDDIQITTAYEGVFSSTDLGTALASMCTNGPATVPAVYRIWKTEHTSKSAFGYIDSVPNLKKGVIKDGDEYRTLIYRDKFPRVRSQGVSVHTDLVAETSEVQTNEREEYPQMSHFLGEVASAVSVCEEAFTYESKSGYSVTTNGYEGIAYGYELVSAGSCPLVGEGEPVGTIIPPSSGVSSAEYKSRGSVFTYAETPIASYLQHLEAEPSYINSWINPHWSYFYWFPSDAEDSGESWPISSSSEYWYPLKDQYMAHPSLPSGGSKRRTSIVGNALAESALGVPAWYGYTRFEADVISATGRYNLTGATITSTGSVSWSGSSLVFSGSGIVEYELGQWESPYFSSLTSVALGYSSVATGSYILKLIGRDTSVSTNVLSGTQSGVIRFEAPTGDYYAGSYGQDLDVGLSSIASIGGSSDISLQVLEDNPHCWSLLVGYMPKRIRVEASAGLILGLTFLGSSLRHDHLWETGQLATVARDRANGFRYGNTTHWNYLLDQWSEQPIGLANGSKPTALDWLAYKRYMFLGKVSDDHIQDEIEEVFHTYEGITRRSLAYDTVSWIKTDGSDVIGLYTNTYREIPPLAVLPEMSRDADYAYTGEYVQHSYDWATSSRGIISRLSRTDIYDDSNRLTSLTGTVSGWKRTKYIPTYEASYLENPALRHIVHETGSYLASALPWHSYLVVGTVGSGRATPSGVAVEMSNLGQLIYATVSSGIISVGYHQSQYPEQEPRLTAVTSGYDVNLGISDLGYLHMAYCLSGSVYRSISYDYTTFSSGILLGTGREPRISYPYLGYVDSVIKLINLQTGDQWSTSIACSSFDMISNGGTLDILALDSSLRRYQSNDRGLTFSMVCSSIAVSGESIKATGSREYYCFGALSSGVLTFGNVAGSSVTTGSNLSVSSFGGLVLGDNLMSLTLEGSSLVYRLSGDNGLSYGLI